MNALPEWFSPPDDIIKKAQQHKEMLFFSAYEGDVPYGFLALKIHNKYAAEIYNMGVMKKYHRKGTGAALLKAAENYLAENNYIFITVKTLDFSANYKPYEQTRAFYLNSGFIPIEVFPEYWDKDNPCLYMVKSIK